MANAVKVNGVDVNATTQSAQPAPLPANQSSKNRKIVAVKAPGANRSLLPKIEQNTNLASNDELVSTHVNKIVAEDGKLMQFARSDAKKGMAEKGLHNSSAAIQAGQSAVYREATKIAEGDANSNLQHGLANKNIAANIALEASKQSFAASQSELARKQQSSESLLSRAHQSQENTLTREQQANEAVLNREHDASMESKRYDNASSLQQEQADIQTKRDQILQNNTVDNMGKQHILDLERISAGLEADIEKINIQGDINTKLQYAQGVGNIISSGMDQFGSIYGNPELDAAAQQRAAEDLTNRLNGSIANYKAIYGVDGESVEAQEKETDPKETITGPVYGPYEDDPANYYQWQGR